VKVQQVAKPTIASSISIASDEKETPNVHYIYICRKGDKHWFRYLNMIVIQSKVTVVVVFIFYLLTWTFFFWALFILILEIFFILHSQTAIFTWHNIFVFSGITSRKDPVFLRLQGTFQQLSFSFECFKLIILLLLSDLL